MSDFKSASLAPQTRAFPLASGNDPVIQPILPGIGTDTPYTAFRDIGGHDATGEGVVGAAPVFTPSAIETSGHDVPFDRLIYDFGTLTDFEARLRDGLMKMDNGSPGLGKDVAEIVRHELQAAVLQNPGTREITLEGTRARIKCLDDLSSGLNAAFSRRFEGMPEEQIHAHQKYQTLVANEIASKKTQLKDATELSPINSITSALFALASKVGKQDSNVRMSDSEREWHEKQMRANLTEALDLARQIKRNAGNPQWEQSHGKAAFAKVDRAVKNVGKLASKAGGQVNDPELSMRMHEIKSNLDTAADQAASKAFRETLKKFVTDTMMMIMEAVKKLTNSEKQKKQGFKLA